MHFKIPDYQIGKVFFRSSRTIIYKAIRTSDQFPVLIKVLNEEFPQPQQLVRFEQEYQLTRSLSIEGIVQFFSLEKIRLAGAAPSLAILMEDFEGKSLHFHLQQDKIPLEQFLKIAIRITEILDKIHRQKVIHKDLNPRNILWNQETEEVRIVDFGLAQKLHADQSSIDIQKLDGSLPYMAPEQTGRMNRAVDTRTDLYSLGITLYQLLTNVLPFQSKDTMELVHAHLTQIPLPPHKLKKDIPLILSDIVMKLLAKNMDDRYQSCHGLKVDLEKCFNRVVWRSSGTQDGQANGYLDMSGLKTFSFELGEQDFIGQFQMPTKLFGREKEQAFLSSILDRLLEGQGPIELVVLTGDAGVGKSALAHDVFQSITKREGFYISGKYDQLQRDIPYTAISQALNGFCHKLLAGSPSELKRWQKLINNAVGTNGQVLIELLPHLEAVIGPQPPIPPLPAQESKNRFHLLFQNFIKTIAYQKHPLVMFLDDLQWVDPTSLELIQLLLNDKTINYLLIVVAYREKEVDSNHPLVKSLANFQEIYPKQIHTLNIDKLDNETINSIIAETLQCDLEYSRSLSNLVAEKTHGNAFFLMEFLKSLHHEKLLSFDPHAKGGGFSQNGSNNLGWHWEIEQIKAKNITDNVVALMAEKINQLAPETQNLLKWAACLGEQFELKKLTLVYQNEIGVNSADNQGSGQSGAETTKEIENPKIYQVLQLLEPAIEEGLILSLGSYYLGHDEKLKMEKSQYKFSHQRVQEAAYSLIRNKKRTNLHIKIGKQLLTSLTEAQLDKNPFVVVNHFNKAYHYFKENRKETDDRHKAFDEADYIKLAELNLKSGRKAKKTQAYPAALNYLKMGVELLSEFSIPTSIWQTNYSLVFDLYLELAEATYLTSDFKAADQLYNLLLEQTRSKQDQYAVYALQLEQFKVEGKYRETLSLAQKALELLGINVPHSEEEAATRFNQELAKHSIYLSDRKVADLVNDTRVAGSKEHHQLNLLASLSTAALILSQTHLLRWTALKKVMICLKYGHSDLAPVSYASYACHVLADYLRDYQHAYDYGKMAVELSKHYNNLSVQGRTHNAFTLSIHHWFNPLSESLVLFRKAIQYCIESGDFVYAGYAIGHLLTSQFICGRELKKIQQETEKYLPFLQKTNQVWLEGRIKPAVLQVLHQLIGDPENSKKGGTSSPQMSSTNPHFVELLWQEFDEEKYLQEVELPISLAYYYSAKFRNLYWFGLYDEALVHLEKLDELLNNTRGVPLIPETYFFIALTLTAILSSEPDNSDFHERIEHYQSKMKSWADTCPDNFQHKYLLVEAERAKLEGNFRKAISLYKQGIASARKYHYLNNEALGNELFSKFWLSFEEEDYARIHMIRAHALYQQWGAVAKIRELEQKHPQLLRSEAPPIMMQPNETPESGNYQRGSILSLNTVNVSITGTTSSAANALDLDTIIKVSQAISGEINLVALVSRLMEIIIENAGAGRGLLVLKGENTVKKQEFFIEGSIDSVKNEIKVLQSIPLEQCHLHPDETLPQSIVLFAMRTQKPVLIGDASQSHDFSIDPYFSTAHPQSILCIPLKRKDQIAGALYLENNILINAFTKDRVQIMDIILSQAAISLENARLYEDLKKSVEKEVAAKKKLQQLNVTGGQLAQLSDRKQVLRSIFLVLQQEAGILRCSLYLAKDEELVLYATLPDLTNITTEKKVKLGEGIIGTTAQERKSYYIPDTRHSKQFPMDVKTEDEALLCFPLLDGTVLIGIICLTAHVSRLDKDSQDRMITETVCNFLAISLKNIKLMEDTRLAIRMETELQTASAVQQSLFPKRLPILPNLQLSGYYQSAFETGGDWYGVCADFDNTLIFVIGDVTGHGTPSALVTASACSAFHSLTRLWKDIGKTPTPADILHYLNQIISQIGAPRYLMTFFVASLDLNSGMLTYANAGHNFPILIRNGAAKGGVEAPPLEKRLLSFGLRLGDQKETTFTEKTIQLEIGDLLVFFTDGLTEAENGEGNMWGERRLVRLLKKWANHTVKEIVDEVVVQMLDYSGNQPLQDDVTILSCQITKPFSQSPADT